MKRSFTLSTSLFAGALTLAAAAPAFAEDYYSTGDDAAGALFGGSLCAIWACVGVFAILSLVFWIWMLVDLLARQEYEFPGSTGNSKTTWLIVMFASWILGAPLIASIVYYLMVFKKVKRGSGGPPAGGYQPPMAQPPTAPPPPPMTPPASPAPPAPPVPPAPPAGPMG